MTGKPTTLGDLAYVFHGVGNADIFTPEKLANSNNQKDVDDCRVIKASDVTSQRPWQQPDTITWMKVSKRVVSSTKRRGLGQSCILQPGDLLLTTRGKPKVSPMLTYEMTKDRKIIAGPEILVIRAKEGVFCASLREALKQKAATVYFESTTTRKNKDKAEGKGWDKSGVLSKEAAAGLPIPAVLTNQPPRFGEDVEILSHKAESLIAGIQSLNHAIIEAARWREEVKIDSSQIPHFDQEVTSRFTWEKLYKERSDEIRGREIAEQKRLADEWLKDPSKPMYGWEWIKPFNEERKKLRKQMDEWSSQGLCRCLKNLANSQVPDADTELLCQLLSGTKNPESAKQALLGDTKLLEATTLLAHQLDLRVASHYTSKSVRTLLASCAESAKSALILSAETGNLAVETLNKAKSLDVLSLVEAQDSHRHVAKAVCDLNSSGVKIFDGKKAYRLPEQKIDIVLLEASGFDMDNKEDDQTAKFTSQDQFQWSQIEHRINSGGCMIAHLPTSHWRLLVSVINNVSLVMQLPPLSMPVWNETPGNGNQPSDQGIIVVLRPGYKSNDKVKLVDATKLNNGMAASSLTPEQILDLRAILRGDTEPSGQVQGTDIPRRELFKEMRIWPGISTLMKKNVEADDLVQAYTLETLVEEFKYRHFLWKKAETEIFREIGLQSDF
jgi:hypothetical protein